VTVTNAVLSIVSSVIGGALVLAGQFFTRRAEDRRQWLVRLHEAASDLATSYLQEAATVNDKRRSGIAKARVATTTYVVDRQRALGRFKTLPWGAEFEVERQAMGRGIQRLWEAWDEPDEEFDRAYHQVRAAASEFMAAVGRNLMRPKARG
jgi:hypothetical protein